MKSLYNTFIKNQNILYNFFTGGAFLIILAGLLSALFTFFLKFGWQFFVVTPVLIIIIYMVGFFINKLSDV